MSFLTGSAPQVQMRPIGASGGGLTTSYGGGPFSGGGYNTTADPTRTASVAGVTGTYDDLARQSAGLGAMVAPGYNDLLTQQLGDINNSAHKAIGDLRTNMQSRRILGSSFGQDTLTRAEAEFSKQRKDTIAQTFLQSLDARNKLLRQEFEARTAAANTGLNEMNLEAGIANGLIASTNKVMSDNAQFDARLEALSQSGAGKFIGTLAGGGLGFALGGPAGALTGARLGSGALGGSFGGTG